MRRTLLLVGCGLAALGALELFATVRPNLTSYLSQTVRRPSGYVNARVLAAGVAETETAPTLTGTSGARLVAIFRCDCPTYYFHTAGTAASEPTGDVTDGTASEGNPSAFNLAEGESYSLLSPTTCHFTIAYYPER